MINLLSFTCCLCVLCVQCLYTLGWLLRGNPALQRQFVASDPWGWLSRLLAAGGAPAKVQLKVLLLLHDLAVEQPLPGGGPAHVVLDGFASDAGRCSLVANALARQAAASDDAVEKVRASCLLLCCVLLC